MFRKKKTGAKWRHRCPTVKKKIEHVESSKINVFANLRTNNFHILYKEKLLAATS